MLNVVQGESRMPIADRYVVRSAACKLAPRSRARVFQPSLHASLGNPRLDFAGIQRSGKPSTALSLIVEPLKRWALARFSPSRLFAPALFADWGRDRPGYRPFGSYCTSRQPNNSRSAGITCGSPEHRKGRTSRTPFADKHLHLRCDEALSSARLIPARPSSPAYHVGPAPVTAARRSTPPRSP